MKPSEDTSNTIDHPGSLQGTVGLSFFDFCAKLKGKILFWSIPAIIITAVYLHRSEFGGRLSIPPNFDDVVYLQDGLKRLVVWETSGFEAFRSLWHRDQPHSPGSTLQAMISFAILGPSAWAPYASNVIFVLLLFLLFDFLTGAIPGWKRACLFVLLLGPPMLRNMIVEFRPDLPSSLLLACGIILVLHGEFFWQPRWYQALAGIALGLSLWMKPTAFAASIGIVLGVFGLAVILEFILRFRQTSRRRIFVGLLLGWGTFALIGLPYVLANAKSYITYMRMAFYGPEKPIEDFQGSFFENLRYYWDGSGAEYMVGRGVISGCFLLFIGSLIFLWMVGPRKILFKYLAYFCVLMVLFAGPTYMPVKTPFFGSNFQVLTLLLAISVMAGCCRRLPKLGALISIAFAFHIFVASPKYLPMFYPSSRFEYLNEASDELPRDLSNFISSSRPANLLITSEDWINSWSLNFSFLQKGYPYVDTSVLLRKSSIEAYPTRLGMMDLVIASEPGNPDPLQPLPCNQVLEETLAQVRGREEFSPIGHVALHNGKGYSLFGKTNPFFGFVWDDSLFPVATLPGLGSPTFAGQNKGDSVLLAYHTPQDFHLNLDLKMMSELAAQRVHVSLNGSEIAVFDLPEAGKWCSYMFDLPPTLLLPGASRNCVNFNYEATGPDTTVALRSPVYFQEIRIRPVSAGLWGASRGGLAACRPSFISAQ
jgi:hypothetical protein